MIVQSEPLMCNGNGLCAKKAGMGGMVNMKILNQKLIVKMCILRNALPASSSIQTSRRDTNTATRKPG